MAKKYKHTDAYNIGIEYLQIKYNKVGLPVYEDHIPEENFDDRVIHMLLGQYNLGQAPKAELKAKLISMGEMEEV